VADAGALALPAGAPGLLKAESDFDDDDVLSGADAPGLENSDFAGASLLRVGLEKGEPAPGLDGRELDGREDDGRACELDLASTGIGVRPTKAKAASPRVMGRIFKAILKPGILSIQWGADLNVRLELAR